MSVDYVFMDSFSHFATGDLEAKYNSVDPGSGSPAIDATAGPRGSGALIGSGAVGQLVRKTLGATAGWAVAFAAKLNTLPTGSAGMILCTITDVGQTQVDLRVLADGTLRVTRAGTALATGTTAVNAGVYFHVELKASIGTAAGGYGVKLNGVDVIPYTTGANTQATGNATANGFALGSVGGDTSGAWAIADLFVQAGAGSGPTVATPSRAVVALLPNAAGDLAGFTPLSGQNYTQVRESPPDGDTTYVESSTSGTADLYGFADLPAGVTAVTAVQVVVDARKSADGTASLNPLLRSASTTATGAAAALDSNYQMATAAWPLNPAGGTAWDVASVNSSQAGMKVV